MAVHNRADFRQIVETGETLNKAMEVLSEREKKIIIAHTKGDLTFKQIGEKLDISESQTSRIYKQCIEKMRKALSA